jgi:hypothetical protein
MREIRQSGSVRGVRRNLYPYRDPISLGCVHLRLPASSLIYAACFMRIGRPSAARISSFEQPAQHL